MLGEQITVGQLTNKEGMTMHIHVPTINATLLSLKNVVFRITSMKNE
jgi:hypothetical protein